jgi:glycosyltransferase involved in cell wall biosynthesis
MRVCYVLKRFPRLSQTFVLEELLELQRQGVPLAVVARGGPGGETPFRALLTRFPVEYMPPGADEQWVASRLRALGATHVHAHFAGWAAEMAARATSRAGLPYTFTAHATDIYRTGLDESALVERMSGARAVVTVTDANRRHLQRMLARHDRGARVLRIYNGVDVHRLHPVLAGRDRDLVVGVGRLVTKKGHAVLVEAIRQLRERQVAVRLTVVGDGPLRENLERQVRDSRLTETVTLLGARPHEEVLGLLSRATTFALPSTVADDGDRDALPTVVLEAMALATPVVSTTVSGIPEQVDSGRTGLLVPPDDPGALADALQRLLLDSGLRGRYTCAARALAVERFDLRRNVAALRRVFSGEAG